MKNKDYFVFDVNVIVSALLFKDSKPRSAFDKALDCGSILMSLPVFLELIDVLDREKFDRYVSREERYRFLAALAKQTQLIGIREMIRVCRDPKDDKYLELAASGGAKIIISGDTDLLALNPFGEISIMTPAEFLSFRIR